MRKKLRRFTADDRFAVRDRHSLVERIGRLVPLKRRGPGLWWGCCPFHHEKTPSFRVNETKGLWTCYGCGLGGDVVEFEMRSQGLGFVEAMKRLLDEAGLAPDTPAAEDAAQRRRAYEAKLLAEEAAHKAGEADRCRRIWAETVDPVGTIAEAYFASRGLTMPIGWFPRLRLHPGLKYWVEDDRAERGYRCLGLFAALVGLIQRGDGSPAGVHMTYLNEDGTKLDFVDPETGEKVVARKMRGELSGGAIHLCKPRGGILGIGEGWETCLHVLQASLLLDDDQPYRGLPVWAALSLHNLGGGSKGTGEVHPLDPTKRLPSTVPDPRRPGILPPPGVREVILLEDGDTKDLAMGEALGTMAVNRWHALDLTVKRMRAPVGMDYDDLGRLIQGGEA